MSNEPATELADSNTSTTAAERIRTFEDTHLPNAVRIGGVVETGHGSPFKELPISHQRYHAALLRLKGAEEKVAAATSALAEAEAEAAAARSQADNAAPEAPPPEFAPEPEPSTERSESEQAAGG